MSVADTTDKCFLSDIFGVFTVEDRDIVVDGDTRDEVPIPNSGYIFILIALEVCVNNTVREMETKKLYGISVMVLMGEGERTHVLRVRTLCIPGSC